MSNRWVRHSRAYGNPLVSVPAGWIPADAGMTDEARWCVLTQLAMAIRQDYDTAIDPGTNDFQVQGKPPVIQPIQRVLNHVPCFQLNTYNSSTQSMNPTQTLCFNGGEFVPAGEAQSLH